MLILLILYAVIPGIQLYFYLSGQFGVDTLDIINYSASILALHWLLANVAISSKIPILQKCIPYDRRIKFHIYSTSGIVIALIYHATYKFLLGYNINLVTWLLLGVISLMMVTSILWIPIPIFSKLRTAIIVKLKKGAEFNYDKSKNLHIIFILLLSLLLMLHVLGAGLFTFIPPISLVLYIIFYALSFGLFTLSKTNIFRTESRVLSVFETMDIITLNVEPNRTFNYRPGQFTFIETSDSKKRREAHPFSFLSIPTEGRKTVTLAIRAAGDFTSSLKDLKPGDKIFLNGAFGDFRPKKEKRLCFIASGIGTVPIISIIKDLHASGDKREIHLFLAVNDNKELPEKDLIVEITNSMENVTLHLMVYNLDQLRYSKELFKERIDESDEFSYYICSSPGVRNIVVKALTSIGVKRSKIHFEAFSFG